MQKDSEPDSKGESLRKAVRSYLGESRTDYVALGARVDELLKAVREEIAEAIQEPLNHHASSLPQATYADEKHVAHWVNAELRRMGLALRCPSSGQPSILQANIGYNPNIGKFRLDYMDAEGKHRNQTVSVQLFRLDPMLDTTTHTPHRTRTGRNR